MRRLTGAMAAVAVSLGLAGCVKPDIPYPQLEAKYASPTSRYADLGNGVVVHYRDEGRRDGRTIVLVHGFSASLHAWEPWVRRLSGDYRLISLDLPGHGLTRAPAGYRSSPEANVAVVDALTRRLGSERFVLAGNSMGGAVAWNYALAHPDRLDGLVLVDAAGWPGERDAKGAPLLFRLLANPAGRAVLRHVDPRPMAEGGLKQAYLDPGLVTPALVDRYVELARAPGHRDILISQQSRPRTPVTRETFARISAPTLVMTGEDDKLIPAADARGFAGAIPGARLVVYPGVGHVPMEQIPDRSAADLRAFLESLPAR